MSFFGHTWNTTGISPDPRKVQAIRNMTFPEDKETMHSFLGLINFLNRYSGELAQHTSPLYRLTQKNGHYTVTEEHRSAFQSIKDIFEQKIVLPYFSTEKKCILQVDASKKGFGAVLIQDENPVYYASQNTLKGREELPKSGKRMHGSSMGYGKVPLLSFWKALRVANRSEASSFHSEETYDRCHTKDAKDCVSELGTIHSHQSI